MSTVGNRLLASMLAGKETQVLVELRITESLFRGDELEFYKFVMSHVSNYGKFPARETVEDATGLILPEVDEPPAYYHALTLRRKLHTDLKTVAVGLGKLLQDDDPDKALDLLLSSASDIHNKAHSSSMLDFRDVGALIHSEYMKMKSGAGTGEILFGWPELDKISQGLGPGDVASFVGRPASGKTFMILWVAMQNWLAGKGTPVLFSMEMSTKVIAQRMAAMYSSKNLTQLMKAMMTTTAYNEMQIKLGKAKKQGSPFWVLDGNLSSTVDDVVLTARQTKPCLIAIDGAYLMKSTNPRLGRFDIITANVEDVKRRVATDCGIPTICSYQLGRTSAKKQKEAKGQATGLEDIYGSDAIGQVSSIVVGLFEDENIATQRMRALDVLKGRSGETGRFSINWDFHRMDFSQVEEDVLTAPLEYID